MKKVSKNRVIERLDLRPFGQKGWMKSSSCECPQCKRFDKFGIKFSSYGGTVHCFHDNFSESLFRYLDRIGCSDLVDDDGAISIETKLKSLSAPTPLETETIERQLPIGFVEVEQDSYLDERNFLPQHYKLFRPGYSSDPLLSNYIIFQLFQFGKRIGYQSRSKYSKEWHKKNLQNYKLGVSRLVLRYRDQSGMDTSKILGGCDDLDDKTTTLILVEGLFDKTSVDKKLQLYLTEDIRCCFTFGNKLSIDQIKIIKSFRSITRIYLLYDFGTTSQIKKMAMELSKSYVVLASEMKTLEDPGDADVEKIYSALESAVPAIRFFSTKISSRIL